MPSKLLKYRIFLQAARKAVKSYARELKYYFRAKTAAADDGDAVAMRIRKRAHHLERYLFKPEAYGEKFGADIAAELESLLENANNAPARQVSWAKKILSEYHAMGTGAVGCRLMNENVRAPAPAVDTAALMRLIRSRRTKRFWLNEPLTDDERARIAEAAQWTPSSCNRQTFDLIFVEEPELKSFVASTIGGGFQFFNDAPSIVVLVSDARDYRYPDDRTVPFAECGAAIQNIYLVCETMGLGCCWGSYTSFNNVGREDEVRARLGIPDAHLIAGAVAVGRSRQFICSIPRSEPRTRFGVNGFRKRHGP